MAEEAEQQVSGTDRWMRSGRNRYYYLLKEAQVTLGTQDTQKTPKRPPNKPGSGFRQRKVKVGVRVSGLHADIHDNSWLPLFLRTSSDFLGLPAMARTLSSSSVLLARFGEESAQRVRWSCT